MVFTTKEERKDFILNKQYLVFAIIKKTNIFFMNAILQVDDLVSHGTIGLIDAVDKYDPEKGAFNQYARRRILGEIFEGMRSTDHLKRTARKKVKNGQRKDIVFISQNVRDDKGLEVENNQELTDIMVNKKMKWDNLNEVLNTLPVRDKLIFNSYINKGLTMREVGKKIKRSESRAKQLIDKIVIELKNKIKK